MESWMSRAEYNTCGGPSGLACLLVLPRSSSFQFSCATTETMRCTSLRRPLVEACPDFSGEQHPNEQHIWHATRQWRLVCHRRKVKLSSAAFFQPQRSDAGAGLQLRNVTFQTGAY